MRGDRRNPCGLNGGQLTEDDGDVDCEEPEVG